MLYDTASKTIKIPAKQMQIWIVQLIKAQKKVHVGLKFFFCLAKQIKLSEGTSRVTHPIHDFHNKVQHFLF